MNTAAAVCMCVPAFVYAVFIRFSAVRRRRFFEHFQKFVYLFGVYSSATRAESAEIILKTVKSEGYPGLSFAENACKMLRSGVDFESAWNRSVNEKCPFLTESDKSLVGGFVSAASASDPVTQERTMKIYNEEIENKLKKLAEYEKKDMRSKCAVVIFIGCAAALTVL